MNSQARGRSIPATSLWYERQGVAVLRREEIFPAPHELVVRTSWSAISRGTERLVFSGRIPESEHGRMRAPHQDGEFPFPVKYGYCAVGKVLSQNDELSGRAVFALYPHQDIFCLPADAVAPLPEGLPERRATLAANMETALNAVWDSGAGPGDHIAVIGAGVVGLLIACLAARLPGARVVVADLIEGRAALAQALGAEFVTPGDLPRAMGAGGADVVFHTSASAGGLATAIDAAGFEARIVEASWHGAGDVPVPLGGAFHSRRLQFVSTQVGHVAPSRRSRWTHRRRLVKALELLCDDRLDALIGEEFAFADLPEKLPGYFAGGEGVAAVVRYEDRSGAKPVRGGD